MHAAGRDLDDGHRRTVREPDHADPRPHPAPTGTLWQYLDQVDSDTETNRADAPAGCAEEAQIAVRQDGSWQEDPAFAELYAAYEAWIFEMLQDPA